MDFLPEIKTPTERAFRLLRNVYGLKDFSQIMRYAVRRQFPVDPLYGDVPKRNDEETKWLRTGREAKLIRVINDNGFPTLNAQECVLKQNEAFARRSTDNCRCSLTFLVPMDFTKEFFRILKASYGFRVFFGRPDFEYLARGKPVKYYQEFFREMKHAPDVDKSVKSRVPWVEDGGDFFTPSYLGLSKFISEESKVRIFQEAIEFTVVDPIYNRVLTHPNGLLSAVSDIAIYLRKNTPPMTNSEAQNFANFWNGS